MPDPIEMTRAWVRDAVVAFNLCPFAAKPFNEGTLHFTQSDATDLERAISDSLQSLQAMIADPDQQTTLLVFPNMFVEFYDLMDAASLLEMLLAETGAETFFLVATFHPEYQFEGEEDPKLALTNQSPYPMFHFIRTADFDDVDAELSEQIVSQNRATIESLADRKIRDAWPHL